MTRFSWDYPTQGTRFARTSEQAFGPYCGMSRTRGRNRSAVLYAVAWVLVVCAVVMGVWK